MSLPDKDPRLLHRCFDAAFAEMTASRPPVAIKERESTTHREAGRRPRHQSRAKAAVPKAEDPQPRLPDNVFFEILLRSPVKSLLRFRCVCKDWFAQISSSVFKEKHLAHRLSRYDESLIIVKTRHYRWGLIEDVLTCYDDYQSLTRSKSSYNHDMVSRGPSFSTHVNGIVCLFCFADKGIVLFNPALRETREVPDLGIPGRIRVVGFGYDDSTKDYIVVQIVSFSEERRGLFYPCTDHRCAVYHLTTDAWTMVDTPAFMTGVPYFSYSFPFVSSFFSHGSIHWCLSVRDRILTFNTTSKLFQEIEFPGGWRDYYRLVRPHLFKADNSCIALVAECEHVLDVWLMKEYGVRDSWTKQYSISSSYETLYFLKTNKLLLVTLKKKKEKMVCYDLSIGQQADCLPYSRDSMPKEVVTCYESLFSIKAKSALGEYES